jgi:opacity protein-like surface antigen
MKRFLAIAVFVAAVACGYAVSAQATNCQTDCNYNGPAGTTGGGQTCHTTCY